MSNFSITILIEHRQDLLGRGQKGSSEVQGPDPIQGVNRHGLHLVFPLSKSEDGIAVLGCPLLRKNQTSKLLTRHHTEESVIPSFVHSRIVPKMVSLVMMSITTPFPAQTQILPGSRSTRRFLLWSCVPVPCAGVSRLALIGAGILLLVSDLANNHTAGLCGKMLAARGVTNTNLTASVNTNPVDWGVSLPCPSRHQRLFAS